ncbi:MAG: hypothetical protein IKK21_05530 [Clostridia bacterium]|nr:hypothetical protein [Clostridia bacterium]
MTGYVPLLKLTVRNRLAALRSGSWHKDNGKPDWSKIAQGVAIALLAVMLLGGVLALEIVLFKALSALGQVWLLPTLALMIAMLGMVVMGFFTMLSRLYFNKDAALMAYLPVKSGTVLLAKATEIYAGELGINAMVVQPAFIMVGIHNGAGVGYWLTAAMVTLLTPMIPMALLMLLATVIARLTSFSRHKETLIMIFSLAMVFIVMGLEMAFMVKVPEDATGMYFLRLLLDQEALVNTIAGAVPPVRWALDALRGQGLQLLLLTVVSVAALAAVLAYMAPRYLSIALTQQERASRRRAIKTSNASFRMTSPLMSLYRLELRTLFRTPAYAFNGVYGALVFPLIMVYMVVMSEFSEDMSSMKDMLSMIDQLLAKPDQILILTGVMGFCCCINPAAATAVTREGRRLAYTRILPVSPRTILTSKLMMGITTSLMTCGAMAIVACFLIPVSKWVIAAAFVLAMLLSATIVSLCLALDASRPLLDWPNETYAIKQSSNVAYGMLIGFGAVLLPAAAAVALVFLHASPVLRLCVTVALLLVMAAAGQLLLRRCEGRFTAWEKGL